MRGKIEVGRTYQSQTRVEEWMTAEKAGSFDVDKIAAASPGIERCLTELILALASSPISGPWP